MPSHSLLHARPLPEHVLTQIKHQQAPRGAQKGPQAPLCPADHHHTGPQLLLRGEQLCQGITNRGQGTAGSGASGENRGGVNILPAEGSGWHGSHGMLRM